MVPYEEKLEEVSQEYSILLKRLKNPRGKISVEPPYIYVESSLEYLQELARDIALPGNEKTVLEFFIKQVGNFKRKEVKVLLNENVIKMVDINSFINNYYTAYHHNVKINTQFLKDNIQLRKEFVKQLSYFLTSKELNKVLSRIDKDETMSVDEHILPSFAKKTVKKYYEYRGLNCFHAALTFQDRGIPKSVYLHPLRHNGYNWRMINNDELWRVLHEGFYEVEANISELKFGDILAFFDKPGEAVDGGFVDFRWLKHATVYLFGEFTFSKGSKSANTAYTVNTLDEEISKWKSLVLNRLSIKVFRKSSTYVTTLPYADQHDWLY